MRVKSNRPAMQLRKFILRDEKVRESLLALVRDLPIDPLRPVEVVAREEVKARKPDQQALTRQASHLPRTKVFAFGAAMGVTFHTKG